MTLEERIRQLQDVQARFPSELSNIAKNATIRAVEKAVDMTPPLENDLRGTNTRSGGMKQHWPTDSDTIPQKAGGKYTTLLANNKDYASYVNDGHRMARHFVPGLVVNPESGMLEMVSEGYRDALGVNHLPGIVVGTRTQYVEGLFMEEAAHEEYHRVVRVEADRLRRLLE